VAVHDRGVAGDIAEPDRGQFAPGSRRILTASNSAEAKLLLPFYLHDTGIMDHDFHRAVVDALDGLDDFPNRPLELVRL
jgi:hypothetical protein